MINRCTLCVRGALAHLFDMLDVILTLEKKMIYDTVMRFHRKQITTYWFFSTPPLILRWLGIYVNGDALLIIPLLCILTILLLVSLPFGLIMTGLYIAVRGAGEMMYWLLQQFGPKKYRPYDYGLTNLSHEGIYILYQLRALVSILIGLGIVLFILLKITF